MTLDAIQSRHLRRVRPIWSSAFRHGDAGRGPGHLRPERFLVRSVRDCSGIFPPGRLPAQAIGLVCTSVRARSLVPSDTVIVLGVNLAGDSRHRHLSKTHHRVFRCPNSIASSNKRGWIRAKIFRRSCPVRMARALCCWCAASFAFPISRSASSPTAWRLRSTRNMHCSATTAAPITFLDDTTAAAGSVAEIRTLIDPPRRAVAFLCRFAICCERLPAGDRFSRAYRRRREFEFAAAARRKPRQCPAGLAIGG